MGITKQYKNIVWDWNGTLLDDLEVSVETINRILLENELAPISVEHYRSIFGFPVKAYYQQIGFDFSRHSWEAVSIDFIDTYRQLAGDLQLTSGIRPVLQGLQERGYKLYILSALKEDVLHEMLESYHLNQFFKAIYGAEDIYASGKVTRGEELVRHEMLDTEQTVMIGDTLHDAEVADALGFDIILFSGGHNSRERLIEVAPVIDQMDELLVKL